MGVAVVLTGLMMTIRNPRGAGCSSLSSMSAMIPSSAERSRGRGGTGRLVGTGKMPNLFEEGIEFDLHATTVDWDALRLPPDGVASSPPPREADPKGPTSTSPEPDEPTEKGYAVGLLRIDRLKIKEYEFFNWHSAMIYREETLQFRETEANFEDRLFKANFAQVSFRPDGSVALAR